jgi:hypothetical protein
MAVKDISGERFGRLVAIQPVGKDRLGIRWLFKCDCGNDTVGLGAEVRRGGKRSVGAYKKKRLVSGAEIGVLRNIRLTHTVCLIRWNTKVGKT